jgi:hypothetical protein
MLSNTGIGLTVTTTFSTLLQPPALVVTAYVTLISAVELLLNTSLIGLPTPLPADPPLMSVIAARVQLNVAPVVALVGV